jgi:hypothetical protein
MKNCRLISGEGTKKEPAMIDTVRDRIAGDEPTRKEPAMITAPVPVPVHLNVNYIADLNRKIAEQQATITTLTEITKSLFSASDKTRPCFRHAVECFNALWETGAI